MKHKKTLSKHGLPMPKASFISDKGPRAAQMSRVLPPLLCSCSALLCSALLCLLCCQYMAPVSSLSTPFYKLFQDFRKSKTAALQAQSCDTNTGNQSAVSPQTDCSWLTQWVPVAFAPPACAGFADSIYRCVQYTILPQNCKRKAAIFIANCSKFLQILHRAGNMPIAR